MHAKFFTLLFAATTLLQTGTASAEACLKYAPAKVTLTGIIFLKQDFGPPGFGAEPETDTRENNIYINLDKPICVEARGDAAAAGSLGTLQVVYARYPFQKKWAGKHVTVRGTLIPAETAHHWTPVLIKVTQTREIP